MGTITQTKYKNKSKKNKLESIISYIINEPSNNIIGKADMGPTVTNFFCK